MLVCAFVAIALAVGLAVGPTDSEAQRAGKAVPRVGFLTGGSPSANQDAFRQGLRELGYVEGRNIALEYRFADGKYERLPVLATELVRRDVAVIVASTTPAIQAAQRATRTIPIVMTVGEPRKARSRASLAPAATPPGSERSTPS